MNKKLIVALMGVALTGAVMAAPGSIRAEAVNHRHHRHHWCPPPPPPPPPRHHHGWCPPPPPHDPSGRCRGGLRPVDIPHRHRGRR